MVKTYNRKSKVPAAAGTHAKLCPRCDSWYPAVARSRICGNCNRPGRRWNHLSAGKFRPKGSTGPSWRVNGIKVEVDGIEISEFHPDSRVAALVIEAKSEHPRTWRTVLRSIDWNLAVGA